MERGAVPWWLTYKMSTSTVRTIMKRVFTAFALVIGIIFASLVFIPTASAAIDPTNPGSWSTPVDCPGINPIHTALLPSGDVLMIAGSGYNSDNFNLKINQAWVYHTATPNTCPVEIPIPTDHDLFCAGMTHLPDGRILVFGGTKKYGIVGSSMGSPNYYNGIKDAWVFDEATESFQQLPDMNAARWYGTGIRNAAGNIVVVGGLDENGAFTKINETYNPVTNKWTKLLTPAWAFPLYAGMILQPNGNYIYSGTYFGNANGRVPMTWNSATNATVAIPGLYAPQCRDQANTLVMYPKAYVLPGGCPTGLTGTVYSMDMTSTAPKFTQAPTAYAGMHQCGQVLPDKSLFLSGGSNHNLSPTLKAMRLGFGASAWQTLAAPKVARGYHSTCLTLKDGRVLTMGSNWNDKRVETRLEIYNPWYAQSGFNRPTITGLGLAKTSCGTTTLKAGTKVNATYGVATPTSATLTPLPSNTHSSDPNQRVVPLAITKTGEGKFSFTAPSPSNITPPGVYMLSLLDWRGAPSVSQMISIGGADCCC
jgi:hypothetical protein